MSSFSVNTTTLKSSVTAILSAAEHLDTLSHKVKECSEDLGSFSNSFSTVAESLTMLAEKARKESVKSSQLSSALASILRSYVQTEERILGHMRLPKGLIDRIGESHEKLDYVCKTFDGAPGGTSTDTSAYDGDPVDMTNGNFVDDVRELRFYGATSLQFKRHYNSLYLNVGSMGIGWSHNYDVTLLIEKDTITVVWGDQTRERYYIDEEGRFVSGADCHEYITFSEGEYHLHKRKRKHLFFDVMGKLVKSSTGAVSSEVNLTYNENGKLIQATDKFGNSIFYTYDENGLLTKVKDSADREVTFIYDTIFLTKAVAVDGLTAMYEYDDNGRLSKNIGPDGTVRLINTYDDENRVVHQALADGAESDFEYKDNHVRIIDADKSETVYEHDDRGRIVAIEYPCGRESFVYNGENQRIEYSDLNGNIHKREYDDAGNIIRFINPLGIASSYGYDADGNRTEAVIPCKGTVNITYDEFGNITGISDSLGYNTSYSYYEGLLEKIKYPDGEQVTFEYDELGRLKRATNEEGNIRSYVYDNVGRKIEETDGCGNVTKFTYDNADRILTVTDPAGRVRTFKYEFGRMLQRTDFDGFTEQYKYDASGRVIEYLDKAGNKTCYEYDKRSNPVKVIIPNGKVIERKYDAMGRMTEQVGPENNHRVLTYDAAGNCICKEDNGYKTTFEYDAINRVVKEESIKRKVEYTYDEANNLVRKVVNGNEVYEYAYDTNTSMTKIKEPSGKSYRFVYDSRRRLLERSDEQGNTVKYSYYADGKLKKVEFSDGRSEFKEYDATGRETYTENQAGYKIFKEYDCLGRVVKTYDGDDRMRTWQYLDADHCVVETDALGRSTRYGYSPTGKIAFMRDAAGYEVRYNYNELDDVVAILRSRMTDEEAAAVFADPDKYLCKDNDSVRCTIWEKDSFGRILARVDARGNRHEWKYGPASDVLQETDENGSVINREYDDRFNLTKINYPDGTQSGYKYDEFDRIVEIADATGDLKFTYDSEGKLLSTVDAHDQKVSYRYDEIGRRVAVVYPDGNETGYTYNDKGQITRLTTAAIVADYVYDDALNVSARNIKLVNGDANKEYSENYTYNTAGKIVSLTQSEGDKPLSEYRYDYDSIGNIVFKSVILYEGTKKTQESYRYEYDELNHLSKVFLSDGDNEKLQEEYRYDEFGNCIYSNVAGKERINKYDVLDCLINSCSPDGSYNVDYSYDDNGSLIATTGSENTTRDYNYDGNLRRINKDGNTVEFLVNSLGGVVSEKDNTGKSKDYWIDYSDRTFPTMGVNEGNGWRSFYRDYRLLGSSFDGRSGVFMSDEKDSVRRFLDDGADWSDPSKDLVYSHYGEVISSKDNLDNTFGLGYAGLEATATRDTWRTTTREFDPASGRFMSRDKDEFLRLRNPNGLNQYQYCFGNPVIWVDPEGTDCYIFYLPEWENEAKGDRRQLAREYGYDESQVHLIPVTSSSDFENGWNNMGVENGENVDVDTVVLDFHANPDVMGSGGGDDAWYIDKANVAFLQDKDVDNLILLGCNAGHNNHQDDNIASAFAKRVKGAPVIASDGTVYSGLTLFNLTDKSYHSKGDHSFRKWRDKADPNDKRGNDGWMVYQEDNGNVTAKKVGDKKMTVSEMIEELNKHPKTIGCPMSGGGASAGGYVDSDSQTA